MESKIHLKVVVVKIHNVTSALSLLSTMRLVTSENLNFWGYPDNQNTVAETLSRVVATLLLCNRDSGLRVAGMSAPVDHERVLVTMGFPAPSRRGDRGTSNIISRAIAAFLVHGASVEIVQLFFVLFGGTSHL
jgi:hypothetical protein